ncbi:VOC family protein [Paenibacillus turpanensis]|uniref:VOC family protein n=1 Tax=Paenibacillus turpanensis TaxID=2689078 RepID=UPI00140CAE8F|nr:VOC family protein [Paenibacillus turpanensis]
MTSPIQNLVRGVFIPVSSIEKARDWYCNLLGLPADGEIFFGHIYVLPMQGESNIVLDSKIYSPENVHKVPVFQLATDDIERSYEFIQSQPIEIITDIQNNHWFTIKDPDGNVLMICK